MTSVLQSLRIHTTLHFRTISLQSVYTEETVEWGQCAVEDSDSDTGEDSEAAGDY